jgi:hypothetical protein
VQFLADEPGVPEDLAGPLGDRDDGAADGRGVRREQQVALLSSS